MREQAVINKKWVNSLIAAKWLNTREKYSNTMQKCIKKEVHKDGAKQKRNREKKGTHAMGNNVWYWLHFVDNYILFHSVGLRIEN